MQRFNHDPATGAAPQLTALKAAGLDADVPGLQDRLYMRRRRR